MGPLLASPAVRLRWPPPGEHAAAGGSASLVASPRLRAGRRSWRTCAKRGNGNTQRAFAPQTIVVVTFGGASTPTPTWATYDAGHEVNTGSRRLGSCADFRPPRKRAALRCFGAPSWRSGPSGTRAATWARSSLRRPSAFACRHWASMLLLLARLRSSRPQDAAPADFVDTSAPLRRSEHEATPMPNLRCAPSVIAALVVSKSDGGTGR